MGASKKEGKNLRMGSPDGEKGGKNRGYISTEKFPGGVLQKNTGVYHKDYTKREKEKRGGHIIKSRDKKG